MTKGAPVRGGRLRGGKRMIRESEGTPRWLQRREGRYDGNKVVRWIARRHQKDRTGTVSAEASGSAEWPRMASFGMLRLVADN